MLLQIPMPVNPDRLKESNEASQKSLNVSGYVLKKLFVATSPELKIIIHCFNDNFCKISNWMLIRAIIISRQFYQVSETGRSGIPLLFTTIRCSIKAYR